MGAITPTLMQCGAGDHIVSSRTIYGGTYAFLKTSRQDLISKQHLLITKLDAVEAAITPDTKFCIVKP
jgi:methionine-gamma-lyase